MKNELLWKPTSKRIENTSLFQFIKHVNTKHKEKIDSFEALHKWSVENRNYFWDEVWNFYNVIGEKGAHPYLDPENSLPGTKFFPYGKLNYAENLLFKNNNEIAINFFSESGIEKKITWKDLYQKVCKFSDFLNKLACPKCKLPIVGIKLICFPDFLKLSISLDKVFSSLINNIDFFLDIFHL